VIVEHTIQRLYVININLYTVQLALLVKIRMATAIAAVGWITIKG
jgi:hypothetical protein